MRYVFGFLGAGNMGSALVRAVSKSVPADKICICDHNKDKTDSIKNELGVAVLDADTMIENCEFLVLGIKPQKLEETAKQISSAVKRNKNLKIISMLASVSVAKLISYFGEKEYIRIMPSTPVNIGQGVVLYSTYNVLSATENSFVSAFEKTGLVVKISEEKIDVGMALSGCGPAFVYMFIDALAKAGEKLGLDGQLALTLATQTVKGSSMMAEKYCNVEQLKINVCSPGGTTIEGVKSLEKDKLYQTLQNALIASYEKAKVLAKI